MLVKESYLIYTDPSNTRAHTSEVTQTASLVMECHTPYGNKALLEHTTETLPTPRAFSHTPNSLNTNINWKSKLI